MAVVDFADMIGQVRDKLGLGQSQAAKLGKAIAATDLTDAEVDRLVDVVNIELVRIYAGRHIAETMHVVAHEIIETPDVEPDLDDEGKERQDAKGELLTKPTLDPVTGEQTVTRTNATDACPDCHRPLLAARDQDSRIPVLVCNRLHGLSLAAVEGLTPNDIVACGIMGA